MLLVNQLRLTPRGMFRPMVTLFRQVHQAQPTFLRIFLAMITPCQRVIQVYPTFQPIPTRFQQVTRLQHLSQSTQQRLPPFIQAPCTFQSTQQSTLTPSQPLTFPTMPQHTLTQFRPLT